MVGVNEGAASASGGPDAKLVNLLSEMQLEIENFILKMASAFQQSRKEQLIFVINNYDVVLSILSVSSNQSWVYSGVALIPFQANSRSGLDPLYSTPREVLN